MKWFWRKQPNPLAIDWRAEINALPPKPGTVPFTEGAVSATMTATDGFDLWYIEL